MTIQAEISHDYLCQNSDNLPWINIVGGVQTALLVSGILWQAFERDNLFRVNVVRRGQLHEVLNNHPAIATFGFPVPGSKVVTVNHDVPGEPHSVRAYQKMAHLIGVTQLSEEKLFLPDGFGDISFLETFVPWSSQKVVVIGTFSDSPRKMLDQMSWHVTVERLVAIGYFVIQIGHAREVHIKKSYSLLGLLSFRQQLELLRRSNVLVTVDNFLPLAGRLVGIPTVVLWGPSKPEDFGFTDQCNLRAITDQCPEAEECTSSATGSSREPCEFDDLHCMNTIAVDLIISSICEIFKTK